MIKLLQVGNVGSVTGGTGACIWSITRALPDFEHAVAFRGCITPETRTVFGNSAQLFSQVQYVDDQLIRQIRPDIIILHQIAPTSVALKRWPESIITIQYQHAYHQTANANIRWFCSHWLKSQLPGLEGDVCWQGVPKPAGDPSARFLRSPNHELIVGRINTPSLRKWPEELIPFYQSLAQLHRYVHWEFVGCPSQLQPSLQNACQGRAKFLVANWQARKHLSRWDAMLYHHPTLPETFGRTIAESMRAGCIPIVDQRAGFQEQLSEWPSLLCSSTDQMTQQLEMMMNSQQRKRLSEELQISSEKQFSLSAFRMRLLQLLTF